MVSISQNDIDRHTRFGELNDASHDGVAEEESQRSHRCHLYPELIEPNGNANLCLNCHDILRRGNRPDKSIARGYDFGNADRIGLPELNFVEEMCIVRTRVLTSALNLRLPKARGQYHGVRGQVISFADEAAITCGREMPNFNFAGQQILLTIEGSPGSANSDL